MFGNYVFEKSSAPYTDKILLLDDENLNSRTNYTSAFSAHGFEIVRYVNDLAFRIEYEEKLKTRERNWPLSHNQISISRMMYVVG